MNNVGIISEHPDENEFIARAYDAIGYAHRIVSKDPNDSKSEQTLRENMVSCRWDRPI